MEMLTLEAVSHTHTHTRTHTHIQASTMCHDANSIHAVFFRWGRKKASCPHLGIRILHVHRIASLCSPKTFLLIKYYYGTANIRRKSQHSVTFKLYSKSQTLRRIFFRAANP